MWKLELVSIYPTDLLSSGCSGRAMLACDISVTSDMIGPPVNPLVEHEALSLDGWGREEAESSRPLLLLRFNSDNIHNCFFEKAIFSEFWW